jgi:hypothetical protein
MLLFLAYFGQIVNKKRPSKSPEPLPPTFQRQGLGKKRFKPIPAPQVSTPAVEMGLETLIFYMRYYHYPYEDYNKKQKNSRT